MAHMMKNTRNACANLVRHFERNEDIKEYGNENIDPSKSHLNYNLAPDRGNQLEFINNRCEELKVLKRKDVNVMCNWVVTMPKDLATYVPGNEEKFFKKTYEFLENRYGKDNVISAYVHKDEVTPHMHFAFVPVVYDEKKNRYKISAKECVNREDLRTFHNDLQHHLDCNNVRCMVLNEATIEGNKSIEELKRGTATEKLQNALQEVEKLKEDILPLESKKKLLEEQVEDLEGKLLSKKDIENLNIKKTITGAIKGISYDDVINLKKTAIYVDEAIKINKSIKNREEALMRSYEKFKNAKEKYSVKDHLNEINLNKAKKELEVYKKAFDKLPKEVREQLLPGKSKSNEKNRDSLSL